MSPLKCFSALLIALLWAPTAAVAQGGVAVNDSENALPADTIDAIDAEAAAEQPYRFVSKESVARKLSPRYRAGGTKSWFLGRYYRDVWTTTFEVPVIDLEESAGGLTPIERGGGMQTTSLHLEGDDGYFYVLRSVDKTAERSLPVGFRDTFVESIAQDQISAMNPVGALLVPPLARAAGVLHPHPTLVIIPDSPRLGEFREEYAGLLAQFERKPDEDQSQAEQFGFAKNIVGSEKMFEKKADDNDERVDERAYARARLFDMLIGDWDRHDEQWRWAEFDTEHGKRFVAVPRDRDFAFVKFDGFLNRLGRQLGPMTLRRLGDFDEEISDVLGLNWQGSKLDRQVTPSLDREDWVEIADSLRDSLTDEIIDEAVRTWPDEAYREIGDMTARYLKSRRDQLPEVASRYFDLLAVNVDVMGTDKHERFEITRLNADETELVHLKTKKEGDVVREFWRRTFHRDETDEIRLYGLGGNDQFIIKGKATNGILIRAIGGEGDDVFVDSSDVSGFGRLSRFYDTPGTAVDAGGETRVKLSDDPEVNSYEPRRFELNPISPVASIDYNSDDGIFLGGGVRYELSGFRKLPYAARHLLTLNVAPRSRAYNAYYDGRFISIWNKFDGRLEAGAYAAREFRNFYGLGNESDRDARSLFLARMQTVEVVPSLRRTFGRHSYVEFGPRAEYVNVDPPSGLEVGDPGVGFSAEQLTDKYLGGFQSTIALDGRDSTLNTKSGFLWLTQAAFTAGFRTSDMRFGRFSSELRYFYTLPVPGQITLALRVGGSTIVGSFPFFEASALGGSDNLRGFPRTRFTGRSAAYGNADLRVKLFDFNLYILKGELGALGFVDQGRVWLNDEDSDAWHRGYGGGLWMTPYKSTVLTASVGVSDEGEVLDLSVGFQF